MSPENRMKPFGFYSSSFSPPRPQSGSESLFYVFSCFPPLRPYIPLPLQACGVALNKPSSGAQLQQQAIDQRQVGASEPSAGGVGVVIR